MVEKQQSWVREEVEEVGEEEDALLHVRKSRADKNGSKRIEISIVDVGVSNGFSESNGHAIQSTVIVSGVNKEKSTFGNEQKMEELDGILEIETEELDGILENETEELDGILENETEYEEGRQKSENLVFYDKVEGLWKCRICSWTFQSGSVCIDHIQNHMEQWPKLISDKILNSETEGVAFTSAYSGEGQNEKNPGKINLEVSSQNFVVQKSSNSHASLQPSQVSFQGNSVSYKSSKEIESADSDLINVDELEVTELDVERVLQKQTTHDLYCPNCNSCITRRVILRKRKRIIQIPDEELKRSKAKMIAVSKPGIGSVEASHDERVHLHHENDNGVEDDADRFTGPDLFRCLSCFSFFIPNGNGFKLFRIFGDKSRKENVGDEQVPRRKKNWFASMFASNNEEKMAVEQGNNFQAYEGRSVVGVVTLPKLADENGQISSVTTHASEGLVETAENNDTLEHQDKILLSPRNGLSLNGIVIHGAGHRPEKTTEEIDVEKEQFDAYTYDEVEESKLRKKVQVNSDQIIQKGSPGPVHPPIVSQHIITETKFGVHTGESLKVDSILSIKGVSVMQGTGKDTVITIDTLPTCEIEQDILLPEVTVSVLPTITQIGIAVDQERTEVRKDSKIEVIKSIVYGGLAESITSLSVLSSAAGGDAATLNILALGMANLIGGFFIICHNLWELRNDRIEKAYHQVSNQETEQKDRYRELLGQRENFVLHAVVCILSYLIFGLMPILVYGFSFRKSDDKELKLVAVAAASLLCITVLAVGKAYVCRPPKAYLKTVVNFVILGFMASGISYAAGILVKSLLEKLGLFQSSSVANLILPGITSTDSAWASR